MLIAHASISIIANRLFNKQGYKNKKISIVSDIMAGLFGILPDFDLFYILASNNSAFNHHDLISHTPIFWIFVFLILRYGLYAISNLFNKETGKAFNKNIINIFTSSLLIGTLSHLFADLFTAEIKLFYPINNYAYSFLGNIAPTNIFVGYKLHPVFGLELVLIITSLYMLAQAYLNISKFKTFLKYLTIIIAVLISLPYIYIYQITYHKEIFPLQSNGLSNYDKDNDHLIDSADLDTNNDGQNNIQDVDYNKLIDDTYEILNSHKLNGYNHLALNIGGYDSERIILGAYQQQGKAIEPVLYNYLQLNNRSLKDSGGYTNILIDYLKTYKGLSDKESLMKISDYPQGRIFFIMNYDTNKAENIGIILRNDEIGITLPNEKQLKVHTMNNIEQTYGNTNYYVLIQK